jgi:murein DD-endopeptidase MepM/ murein hydrolase activator NlpD
LIDPAAPLKAFDLLDRWVDASGHCLTAIARAHPRRLGTAVLLALFGFGATAFGVAPLTTSNSVAGSVLVSERVQPVDVSRQLDDLAAHDLALVRNDLIRAGDDVDSLLRRLGISDESAAAYLRTAEVSRELFSSRVSKLVQAKVTEAGALDELVVRYPARQPAKLTSHFSRLRIQQAAGRYSMDSTLVPFASKTVVASGTVRSTLFDATDDAGVPDAVAHQLAEVFASDLNLHRELRRGDSFTIMFDVPLADGEVAPWSQSSGRLLAAEFVSRGEVHSAVWYESSPSAKRGAYFDFNGHSKLGSFLASPMAFSKITSGFAMRIHPLSMNWKQHAGVDYAAPTGTPVRSVAEGMVDFAGWQNGYGNVVSIKHPSDRSTVYAHLSRVDVRKNQRVAQGDTIGAVGMTGWATGPHLHFEFKVSGAQQDPAIMASAIGESPSLRTNDPHFASLAHSVRMQLDAAQAANRSGGRFE